MPRYIVQTTFTGGFLIAYVQTASSAAAAAEMAWQIIERGLRVQHANDAAEYFPVHRIAGVETRPATEAVTS